MKKIKLEQFEGLRGVAAVIVFLSHIQKTFFPEYDIVTIAFFKEHLFNKYFAVIAQSFITIFFKGHIAVNIFWIMSAYVLTKNFFTIEIEKLTKQLQLAICKRYFRLMIPAGVSILIAYLMMKLNLFYDQNLVKSSHLFQNNWIGYQYFYEPDFYVAARTIFWNTFFDYNKGVNYNSSLWTLGPEFFGSLFCFFSLFLIYKNNNRFYIYLLLIAVAVLYKSNWLLSFIFGLILSDYDNSSFTEGSFVNKIKIIEIKVFRIHFLPVILLGVVVVMIAFGGRFFGATILESLIIVFLVLKSKYLTSFFSRWFFVWLGKVSFSFYLIHVLVICSFTCFLYLNIDMAETPKVILITLLSFILLLFLSHVYTKIVDENAIKVANKIGNFFVKR